MIDFAFFCTLVIWLVAKQLVNLFRKDISTLYFMVGTWLSMLLCYMSLGLLNYLNHPFWYGFKDQTVISGNGLLWILITVSLVVVMLSKTNKQHGWIDYVARGMSSGWLVYHICVVTLITASPYLALNKAWHGIDLMGVPMSATTSILLVLATTALMAIAELKCMTRANLSTQT